MNNRFAVFLVGFTLSASSWSSGCDGPLNPDAAAPSPVVLLSSVSQLRTTGQYFRTKPEVSSTLDPALDTAMAATPSDDDAALQATILLVRASPQARHVRAGILEYARSACGRTDLDPSLYLLRALQIHRMATASKEDENPTSELSVIDPEFRGNSEAILNLIDLVNSNLRLDWKYLAEIRTEILEKLPQPLMPLLLNRVPIATRIQQLRSNIANRRPSIPGSLRTTIGFVTEEKSIMDELTALSSQPSSEANVSRMAELLREGTLNQLERQGRDMQELEVFETYDATLAIVESTMRSIREFSSRKNDLRLFTVGAANLETTDAIVKQAQSNIVGASADPDILKVPLPVVTMDEFLDQGRQLQEAADENARTELLRQFQDQRFAPSNEEIIMRSIWLISTLIANGHARADDFAAEIKAIQEWTERGSVRLRAEAGSAIARIKSLNAAAAR